MIQEQLLQSQQQPQQEEVQDYTKTCKKLRKTKDPKCKDNPNCKWIPKIKCVPKTQPKTQLKTQPQTGGDKCNIPIIDNKDIRWLEIEENFPKIFSETRHGKSLWKIFLLIALILFLIETLLGKPEQIKMKTE